ncbi:MAG: DUF3341 domain-containing protein [bacterium]
MSKTRHLSSKLYGVVAEFDTATDLLQAAKKVREEGYVSFETYSPFPIHGMDDAMKLKPSIMGWITFLGGSIGLIGGFSFQSWAQAIAYPYIISGKPFFSYPAFVPVTFELMVLFSAFAAVFGMFILNGLPKYHHPVFESKLMEHVNSHSFVLVVEAVDAKFQLDEVKTFLQGLDPKEIDVIGDAND